MVRQRGIDVDPTDIDDGRMPVWDAAAETHVYVDQPSGGGPALLAVVKYQPGSTTVKSTSSTSMTDVDSANLAITFTAPASGKVLVRLSAMTDSNGAAGECWWGLREGTTNLATARVLRGATGHPGDYISCPFYITGLSPGNSYTYKWSFAVDPGSSTIRIVTGTGGVPNTTFPPAIMEVWAAP